MRRMSYSYALGQVSDVDAWKRDAVIARDCGIPVPVLRAFKQVESGCRPGRDPIECARAIRFEPHLFWRDVKGLPRRTTGAAIRAAMTAADMASVPYTPGNEDWRAANGLPCCSRTEGGRTVCRPSRAASCTGSETNRAAFERAFRVNPRIAVTSTSWGAGQVLGDQLLQAFGNDPERAVSAFWADPVVASNIVMIAWWRGVRPEIRQAAANGDWQTVVERYNACSGSSCNDYISRLTSAYNVFSREWNAVRSEVESWLASAGSYASEAGASVREAGERIHRAAPVVVPVAAVAFTVASGFFLWSAWKRRKRLASSYSG